MNDPKDPKNLPPDDFSKTTPFIRSPKDSSASSSAPSSSSSSSREDYASDWEKTNFNYSIPKTTPTNAPPSAAPGPDDWGKTAVNINLPHNKPPDDFGKTFIPGQPPTPPPSSYPNQSRGQQESSGWDMTQANLNVPGGYEDFGGGPRGGGGGGSDYHATTPFIQLPDAERAKYQNVNQPTAAAASAAGFAAAAAAAPEEKKDEKRASVAAVPPWIWYAGVAGFFLVVAVVMLVAAWLLIKPYGYDVMVKGAPPNSDILVGGVRWTLTSKEGAYLLTGLESGPHKIEIKHPQFDCPIEDVTGIDGDTTKEIVAKCRPRAAATTPAAEDECANASFKKGQFAEAAALANRCLDKLGDNFKPEDLLKAMNLYIINFDVNKFDIKPNDLKFLEKAAGYMKKLPPDRKVEVGGHTDSDGPDDKNQVLSNNRAKSVRNALVGFGVKPEMLEERGYGESKPKPGNTNANPDEKFQNRRIEYSLIIR